MQQSPAKTAARAPLRPPAALPAISSFSEAAGSAGPPGARLAEALEDGRSDMLTDSRPPT